MNQDEADRVGRIEDYYEEPKWDLAEWLVNAEDEIEFLRATVARREAGLSG